MGIRVIPVLDVCAGQAVQAVGGDRANYRPIHSRLRPGSDPVQLAKAIRQAYGFNEFYLADLDAITTNVASDRLSGELMALGIQLWMDQGVRQAADILTLVNDHVAAIVVGLETLTHCADLRQIIKCAGADRVVFSLDLRAGRPIFATGSDWPVD